MRIFERLARDAIVDWGERLSDWLSLFYLSHTPRASLNDVRSSFKLNAVVKVTLTLKRSVAQRNQRAAVCAQHCCISFAQHWASCDVGDERDDDISLRVGFGIDSATSALSGLIGLGQIFRVGGMLVLTWLCDGDSWIVGYFYMRRNFYI